VTLSKIDETFVSHFYGVSIEKLAQSQPTDPVFKARGIQVPGANGASLEVDIFMDATGKALSNTLPAGGADSVNPPTWPSADAVTLGEDSMHYILDNAPTQADLQPFYTNFLSLILTQVQDAQGQILSHATVRSSSTNLILEIFLKPDGSFSSYSIKAP